MKNLVLFHLENMPQSWFWQFREELPTLWRWKERSMYFSNCYAAGTSTIFTINGVSYGSVAGLDHLPCYDVFHDKPAVASASLFEVLRDVHGYRNLCIFTGESGAPTFPLITYNMPGVEELLRVFAVDGIGLDELLADVEPPFSLYCFDNYDLRHCQIPYSLWQGDAVTEFGQTQKIILRHCDETFARMMEWLEQRGFLDNTLVVVFGDHGESVYPDFTLPHNRGVPIKAQQSWVPLFFYNSGFGVGHNGTLVSLDDLRATVLGQLFPGMDFPTPDLPFPGIDIGREKREYAYTQNKYAFQHEMARPGEWPKKYAVTDGVYRLHVSSLDLDSGAGGMEMYLDRADPGNCCDLMHLFELDAEGRVVHINRRALAYFAGWGYRFFNLFNPEALVMMAGKYEALRQRLREYVAVKEKAAASRAGVMRDHAFNMDSFNHSNSMFSWPPDPENSGMKWLSRAERPVLLFGASWFGIRVLAMTRFYNMRVAGFMDNVHGGDDVYKEGVKVYRPCDAAAVFPDAIVIGCAKSTAGNDEMETQCRDLGLEYHSYVRDIFANNLLQWTRS